MHLGFLTNMNYDIALLTLERSHRGLPIIETLYLVDHMSIGQREYAPKVMSKMTFIVWV